MVITPNVNAARKANVAPVTLDDLAAGIVSEARIASVLLAHNRLCRVVTETIDIDDPAGTARALAPTVRELFRANADLEKFAGVGEREAKLARVASRYREHLRKDGKIDGAEVFTVARQEIKARQLVTVVGYPRLGDEELRLLDAVAAPGSSLTLPWDDDHAFIDTVRARSILVDW